MKYWSVEISEDSFAVTSGGSFMMQEPAATAFPVLNCMSRKEATAIGNAMIPAMSGWMTLRSS